MPPKIIGTIQGWTREHVDGMLRRWAATTANPRFEIVGFLGAGAYAFVFEIKNSATAERFALKVSRDASTAVDLLRREARMCNLFTGNRSGYIEATDPSCESPCLLALPLCGASLDRFFPVEFANSANARAFAAPLLRSGLRALQELHAEEVTHNDIKPANLCVKAPSVFSATLPPELVLIDFSNAKAAAIARNSKLNNALADIKRRDPKRAVALASDPRALLFETPVEQLRVLAAFEGNVMCAPFVSHFDLEKAYTDDIESLCFAVWKICAGALPWEALSADSPAAVARAKLNAPAACPFPVISNLIAESRELPRFSMPPYNRLIEFVVAPNLPAARASASASASTSEPVSAPASAPARSPSAPRSTRKSIVSPAGAAVAASCASSSSSSSSSAAALESAPQGYRFSARKRNSGDSVAMPIAAASAATAAAHADEDKSEANGSAKRAKTSSLPVIAAAKKAGSAAPRAPSRRKK